MIEGFVLGGLAGLMAETRRWIVLTEDTTTHTQVLLTSTRSRMMQSLQVLYSVSVVVSGVLLGGWGAAKFEGFSDAISAFLIGACPTVLISIAPELIGRILGRSEQAGDRGDKHGIAVLPPSVKDLSGSSEDVSLDALFSKTTVVRPLGFFDALFFRH